MTGPPRPSRCRANSEPEPASSTPEIRTSADSVTPKVTISGSGPRRATRAPPHPLGEGDRARVVGADHHQPQTLAGGEGEEAVGVVLRGPPVAQVVGVDVGHHRHLGRVLQEGAVALVGLDHHRVPRAEVAAGAGTGQRAADDEGRVRAASGQDVRDHRGGRGLAVGAGHRDPPPAEHQGAERGTAVQHPQPAPPGLGELWVVLADGGGRHHGLRVAELLGPVSHVHPGPGGLQGAQVLGVLPVAAADLDPAGQHHGGDPVHPRAADRDEVHRSQVGQLGQLDGREQGHQPITSRVRPASTAAASARATPVRAAAIPCRRSRSASRAGISVGHPRRRAVGVVQQQPAPGLHHQRGVAGLLAVAVRVGHEHGRQADRRRLHHRAGAAPAQHQVGHRVRLLHLLNVGDRGVHGAGVRIDRPGRRRSVMFFGPSTCSTEMPAASRAARASAHGPVDAGRALRAAADQQGVALGRQPVRRPRRSARAPPGPAR